MNITESLMLDLPIPYRNILIYPATVKDYFSFSAYAQSLVLDKNSIPDKKIISMTNLEYIYRATEENPENQPYLFWFDRLLSICLKEDESFIDIRESVKRYKYTPEGKPFFMVGDEKYDSKDFENIKELIAKQNGVELIDENISKEVRDSLKKAREYKAKMNGQKEVTIEDYIVSLAVVTGWTFDYIHSLSIRRFTKAIEKLNNYIHYKIYLTASMSGFVEFKDKSFIKHWLSNTDSDEEFDDVSIDLDEMKNKVSLNGA